MQTRAVLFGSLTLAAVGLFVACGDDPSPVKPSPISASPIASVQVIGPDSIYRGESVQFVASIRRSDGTTKSATSLPNLRWASSDMSVLLVNSSGVVRVTDGMEGLGEAAITASFTDLANVQGSRVISVQPPRPSPYVLSVSADRVTVGSPLSVSWVAPHGRSPSDWISIYKTGSRNEAYDDIWWDYTQGATTGTFSIRAPTAPGLYEFRYFLDDCFEMVAKSSLIEVTADAPASASQMAMSRRQRIHLERKKLQVLPTVY
jgi:hypothetical protein